MEIGDLVKIKYDGRVSLITKVETIQLTSVEYKNTWIHLLGEDVPFTKDRLEVISESR